MRRQRKSSRVVHATLCTEIICKNRSTNGVESCRCPTSPRSSIALKRKCSTCVPFRTNLTAALAKNSRTFYCFSFTFSRVGVSSGEALRASCCKDKDTIKTTSRWFCCAHLFAAPDRWMASSRQFCGMRLLPGTRKPRRTRPCPCPQPANRRTWTPSSWCLWSRRPSQPS